MDGGISRVTYTSALNIPQRAAACLEESTFRNPAPTTAFEQEWLPNNKRENRIMEKKMATPTDLLCRGFPNEFGIFPRALRFDDKPDYSYLRKLFRDLFVHEGYQYDYVFDCSVQRGAQDDGTAGSRKVAAGGRRKVMQDEDDHRASERMLCPHTRQA
ncbi:hypothetical protein C8R47DRAFT_1212850 [Mycena vitilis]|nr:hypothetical protein C8R47DRAFT_1212850 [Mycena vitilis]